MGLFFWLRLKPWFSHASTVLFSIALLLPVLALLGFIDGGRELLALYQDPAWKKATMASIAPPSQELLKELTFLADLMRGVVIGSIITALAARGRRGFYRRRKGVVRVTYPNGQVQTILRGPGLTLLDASRNNGIPHASVRGGRGRCPTCRVRVVGGVQNLHDASAEEQRVLDRINAPPCLPNPTNLGSVDDSASTPDRKFRGRAYPSLLLTGRRTGTCNLVP